MPSRERQTDTRVDIAVIGGGPAGLMAATVAAQAGAKTVLFERDGWVGGKLGLQTQPLQGPRSIYQDSNGVDFCRRLLGDAEASGVEVMLGAEATSLLLNQERFKIAFSSGNIHAKKVILCAGSNESWPEFPGSRLPGVMLAGDAQVGLNVHGKIPGKRALMIGSDNAGLLIAANLMGAGVDVPAVVDESPKIVGREFNAAPLRDAGVELLTSSRIVAATGSDKVEGAVIADAAGNERMLEVDTICLALPRVPEIGLAVKAGSPQYSAEIMGGPVPVYNSRMETSVPGLYVCGDASGVENGAAALETGRMTGLLVASSLGYGHPQSEAAVSLARGRLAYLRRGHRGEQRRDAKSALAREYRNHQSDKPTIGA